MLSPYTHMKVNTWGDGGAKLNAVNILQYIHVSNYHTVHLTLTYVVSIIQ